MTSPTNPYCDVLGIKVPSLDVAKESRDANYYSLLIVVLLERGEPVTLQEAAERFDEAGVAPTARALASLKRCKPGRPPICRDGDQYALDPHDADADLWAIRLGLRPPKEAPLRVVRPDAEPLPTVDAPLTVRLQVPWKSSRPTTSLRLSACEACCEPWASIQNNAASVSWDHRRRR